MNANTTCPVHPVMAQALAAFAPPDSEVHRITEEARIAADLEYNRRKASGELLRRDIDRAHAAELQTTTTNLGLRA